MVESDDQPIVTGSDDNPKVEESSVVSDEFVTETVMKPDSLSESLASFTSDLLIFDVAGQKEDQNKDDKKENMSFFLGGKERTHGGQVVSRGYTCMGARWSSSQAKFVELLRQVHLL